MWKNLIQFSDGSIPIRDSIDSWKRIWMATKCQFLSGNWQTRLASSRKLLRLQSILHLFWAANPIILRRCSVCVWEAAAITIDLRCYVEGGAVILMHFCVFQAKWKRLWFVLGGRSVREATALLRLLLSSSEWFLNFVCQFTITLQ